MTAENKMTLSDELKDWKFWLMCFVAFWTAKFIGVLGMFVVFGIWALVKYFWKQTKSASISSGQHALQNVTSEVQNIPTAARLTNTVRTPATYAKPAMNNQLPINAMPTVAIEASQQSMQEIEDRLYEQIAQEIETNAVDKAIWTKAFAQSGGDDKLTRVVYIKARFEKLMAVETARLETLQREKEEIARIAQLERESVEALRKLPASVEWFDFKVWCGRGYIDKVKEDVERNPLLLTVANGDDGNTALHLAVIANQPEVVKYLVGQGASVSERNNDGETPIDIAKRTGRAWNL